MKYRELWLVLIIHWGDGQNKISKMLIMQMLGDENMGIHYALLPNLVYV